MKSALSFQSRILALVVVAISCGGGARSGDNSGKDAAVSDALSESTNHCSAPAPPPGPVVLQFKNTTGSPLFYYLGCFGPDYSMASAASGFTDELAPRLGCPCTCGDPPSCPTCGACYDNGYPLNGETKIMWYPQVPVPQSCSGQACFAFQSLPLGRYRVTMRFYASELDAVAHTPVTVTVQKDFDYSAPGQIVVLDVGP